MKKRLSYVERCDKVAIKWLDTFKNQVLTSQQVVDLQNDFAKHTITFEDFLDRLEKQIYSK